MRVINKPIDMISWTNEKGMVYPIKFKIQCHDNKDHIFDILKIHRSETEKFAGNMMIKFFCQIDINGKAKEGLIKLERDTLKWRLFKV